VTQTLRQLGDIMIKVQKLSRHHQNPDCILLVH